MGYPTEDLAKMLGMEVLNKIDELGMQLTWKRPLLTEDKG